MTRFDTENEQSYIDSYDRAEKAALEMENNIETLWGQLTDEESAANLAHKYSDPYDVAGKLLALIAKHRAEENRGMANHALSYDIRKAQRTSDRESLVRDLQNAVEALFSEAL